MQTNLYFRPYLREFFLEWEFFQTNVLEKIKTNFMHNSFFLISAVHEIRWKKYCRAGQATDDNMAHAHCMLDT